MDAYKKSRRHKTIGWTISLFSFVLLIMALILALYRATEFDNSIFYQVSSLLNQITVYIFQNTQWPLFRELWAYAPQLHYPNIFVEENLKFLAVLCSLMAGMIMVDSGVHLSKRIDKVRHKAEEKKWERSMDGESVVNDTLTIEIITESKDSWYKRPAGILAMAVVGGYFVNILSKITGF